MNRKSAFSLLFIFFLLFICSRELSAQQNMINYEFNHFGFSFLNNGLFILPPLLWNLVFIKKTPTYYSEGVAPFPLIITENILRISTFIFPFFIPINNQHSQFSTGLTIYSIGLGVYFSSWILLMYFPDLDISKNKFTRLLPAITPIIWLIGIGIMAETPITYTCLSSGFILTHISEYLFRFNIFKYKL